MRRWLRTIVVVVLALGVVGALLHRSRGAIALEGFSWSRLADSLFQAHPGFLLLSLATIFVSYAVRALRWVRFSRYLGPVTFPGIYSATLVGFTAVFLLGRAGEPVRPLLIARKERLPISGTFGIYVLERFFDTASTAVLAGLGLLLVPPRVFEESGSEGLLTAARTTGLILLVGLLAAAGLLLYFRFHGARVLERRLERWRASPGWRNRVAGLLAGFGQGLQAIRTWGDLFAAIAYSAVHWGFVACIYFWVAQSFGGRLGELHFSAGLVVLAFTMVGSTLQLPGIGGGAQLASFLAFTVVFGVEKEPAAAAAVVLWLITFAASSLAGIPLVIKEGWSMAELVRLARAETEAEAGETHVSALGEPPSNRGEPSGPREARR